MGLQVQMVLLDYRLVRLDIFDDISYIIDILYILGYIFNICVFLPNLGFARKRRICWTKWKAWA